MGTPRELQELTELRTCKPDWEFSWNCSGIECTHSILYSGPTVEFPKQLSCPVVHHFHRYTFTSTLSVNQNSVEISWQHVPVIRFRLSQLPMRTCQFCERVSHRMKRRHHFHRLRRVFQRFYGVFLASVANRMTSYVTSHTSHVTRHRYTRFPGHACCNPIISLQACWLSCTTMLFTSFHSISGSASQNVLRLHEIVKSFM